DERRPLPVSRPRGGILAGHLGRPNGGGPAARGRDRPARPRRSLRRATGAHGPHPHRRPMTSERGFALIAVMLVLALLAVVVTEFAFSARLEASMVRAYRDGVQARHLAEAGVQQA